MHLSTSSQVMEYSGRMPSLGADTRLCVPMSPGTDQVPGGGGEVSGDQDNGKMFLTTSGAFSQGIFQNDSEEGGEGCGWPA